MIFSSHYRNYGTNDRVLIWRIAAASVLIQAATVRNLLLVRAYNPDQPRIPRGYRYGGRWVGDGDDYGPPAEGDGPYFRDERRPILVASAGDDFPEIPDRRPESARERHGLAKRIARWLLETNNTSRAAYYLALAGGFINEAGHEIVAYFDSAKSLEELRRAADQPKKGYDIHHIVEQNPARREGFSEGQINSPENKVRIPRFKHWEINGWYGRPNERFGGLSPRAFLGRQELGRTNESGTRSSQGSWSTGRMSTGLNHLSVEQLVSRFSEIGVAQYEAEINSEEARYKRLFKEMTAISGELRKRPGDQRRALSNLYDHPNPQVRLKAAIHTLHYFPDEARRVLEVIIERKQYPQAADARGMLRALEEGTYLPD